MSNEKSKIDIKSIFQKITKSQFALPVTALILVIILSAVVTKIKYTDVNFFSIKINNGVLYGSIIDILNRSCELVILAMGMTLVVASSRGTDISVGSIMAISGALIVRCLGEGYDGYAMLPFFAVVIGFMGAIACGAFNGLLVAKLNIQPMVATLILFTAGRGIAQLISSRPVMDSAGNIIERATGVILYVRMESFRSVGGFIPGCIIPTPIFIAVAFVAITWAILRFTALGTYIKTVGINPKAARLVGINSVFIMWLTYIYCGLSSGVAGLIASSRIYSSDANNIGLNMEMDAILAVALGGNSLAGGKFNLFGSVIGAITIQALTTSLYTIGVPANQLPVYKAIVVILIVLFQSPTFKQMLTNMKNRRLAAQKNA